MSDDTGSHIVWWAETTDRLPFGPFDTQMKAWDACRLSEAERAVTGRVHAPGARVWPRREGDGP